MIISKTPFRMSFIGGGTDLPAFYEKQQGAVISTAIDRYMYIAVNERLDSSIRVSYSKTEIVDSVDQIEHPVVKEIMTAMGPNNGIEIVSVADIPSGTGLGSSSSFAVGLLNALHAYNGWVVSSPENLAKWACDVEIEKLKEPIGKQDQYAAAFGGLRRYLFHPDGTVSVNPVVISAERRKDFFDHTMVYYIGGQRSASEVLGASDTSLLGEMPALVNNFWEILTNPARDLRGLGRLMHAGWEIKKKMGGISTPQVDALYESARTAGALGGKLLGAGQSGFLLLFAEPKKHLAIDSEMWYNPHFGGMRRVKFGYEPEGSRIVYAS